MQHNIINLDEAREVRLSDTYSIQITALGVELADLCTKTDDESRRRFKELTTDREALIKAQKAEVAREKAAGLHAPTQDERDARNEDIAMVKAEIRAWLSQHDYYYVHDTARFWLFRPKVNQWTTIAPRDMVHHNPLLIMNSDYWRLFMEVMNEDGRWFHTRTMSFADVEDDTLNMLRWDFSKPADGDHHPVFDLLMMSLGGGKQENIDHIERLIVAKWAAPANYLLPALILNDRGGTGKSLLSSVVLPKIFGASLVADNVSMGDVTGKFTAHLSGKAVWFVNESAADKTDDDALKRVLGSKMIKSEDKGVRAVFVPNTAMVIVSGNNISGTVRLSNSEIDRRFSVISAGAPLKHYTAQFLECTEDEAAAWMRSTGQHVLGNKDEVARWLGHLLQKHGTLTDLEALHGEDYRQALVDQAPLHETVAMSIFTNEFTYMKRGQMLDYYTSRAVAQRLTPMKKGSFFKLIDEMIADRKLPISRSMTNWVREDGSKTTAEVYYSTDAYPVKLGQLNANEAYYYDSFTRVWNLESA